MRVGGIPATQPVLFDNPIAIDYYGTARGGIPQWRNEASTGSKAGWLAVGTEDVSTFPQDHQAVYDMLTGPRSLVLIDGAEHNDLYDNPVYVQQVIDGAAGWFRTHLA